ncbi:MAG: T9SS type A sorting domain-containing protein [bacterium]
MKKLIIILFVILPSLCSAQNLIVNGDFEQGNKFFSSDYKSNTNTGVPESTYKVDSDSFNWWSIDNMNCYDHTTGSSMMMYINGATSSNKRVWYQTVNIGLNNTYTFSIWIVNLIKDSPAELYIMINNNLVGTIKQSNVVTNEWKNYTLDWKATSDKALIAIIDKNTAPMGNDFGIDDLSLVEKYTVQKSSIFFPDTIAEVGAENFTIPLKVKLYDKTLKFANLSFTTSFKFKADVFLPSGITKGKILKDSLDNSNYRNMTIFCDSVNINDTTTVLTELLGMVLLGDSVTPLDIIDFQWHSPKLTIVALTDGSLSATACAYDIRHIQLFDPISLQIQPNPASDEIEVIIEGDEQGYYTLILYDLQGMEIDKKTWNRNQKGIDCFKFPLNNVSNGVYQVVVKSPWNILTKSVVIVK